MGIRVLAWLLELPKGFVHDRDCKWVKLLTYRAWLDRLGFALLGGAMKSPASTVVLKLPRSPGYLCMSCKLTYLCITSCVNCIALYPACFSNLGKTCEVSFNVTTWLSTHTLRHVHIKVFSLQAWQKLHAALLSRALPSKILGL